MNTTLFEGRYQVLKFFFARGSTVPIYAGVEKKTELVSRKKQTLEVRDRSLPGGQGEIL